MLNHFCTVAGFGVVCNSAEDKQLIAKFSRHIITYGLSFGTKEEFQFRMDLFKKADDFIT